MLTLYDYFRSSACYRVRIALKLKNLAYTTVPVHLVNNGGEQHTDAYQHINPQALVPTLQDDGKIITQSLAIIDYLDETHPSPALLPADAYQKALVRSFALVIVADIHPINNLRALNYLTNEFHISDAQKNQWYIHWLQLGLQALEKKLTAKPHTNTFCFGETPTLADICLVPQLYNARRFQCDLTPYPTLVHIDTACQQLTAFAEATPEYTAEKTTEHTR